VLVVAVVAVAVAVAALLCLLPLARSARFAVAERVIGAMVPSTLRLSMTRVENHLLHLSQIQA
jgi:hypothetical protein